MDGNTLQSLFSQGNPFLAQMGEQAFNLSQMKNQADLSALQQKTSQEAQAFPLEQQFKQAQTDHQRALVRSGNANADATEYANSIRLPKEQAIAENLRKLHLTQSEDQRKQFAAQMTQRMQLAAIAKANKGILPTEIMLQLPPEERVYFKDAQSTALMDAVSNAYHKASPAWQEKRAEEDASLKRTNAAGQWRVDAVEARPAPVGRTSSKPDIDPNNRQQMVNYLAGKKTIAEQLQALKVMGPSMSPEEYAHWVPVYKALNEKQTNDLKNKKLGGGIDLTKVGKNGIATVPITPDAGMGGSALSLPPAFKTVYDKSGKAIAKIPADGRLTPEDVAAGHTIR